LAACQVITLATKFSSYYCKPPDLAAFNIAAPPASGADIAKPYT